MTNGQVGFVLCQKMRKPDCGIATSKRMKDSAHACHVRRCESPIVGLQRRDLARDAPPLSTSEDAKARLWDCNTTTLTTSYITTSVSEDAKARLWDCNIMRSLGLKPLAVSEDAKARLWDCNRRCQCQQRSGTVRQKMRKPDCGIATSP